MIKRLKVTAVVALSAFLLSQTQLASAEESKDKYIAVDGSSTVYPITEAVAEEFAVEESGARVTVGVSGTGGGFKKFCTKETDISNASRPIKKEELAICKSNGVEFIELPVAYDALSVVVNPQNTWVTSITTAELKTIWAPEAQAKITKWSQVRAGWPDETMALFGPGVDSGTYDYFTEAITGKAQSSRGDFTSSEDDNVLVQGVASNKNALGFFGLAYYTENKDRLKAVPVDDSNEANGAGPQMPTVDTVVKGVYQPLARPMFIYVNKASLEKPLVKSFVEFYLENAATLAVEVGYVQLPADILKFAQQRFAGGLVGSVYGGEAHPGVSLAELMQRSK